MNDGVKNKFIFQFKKNILTYTDNAEVQKELAQKLINYLIHSGLTNYKTIFEIGCGTGILTNLIYTNFSYNNFTTVDLIPECQKYINKISKQIKFFAADIEKDYSCFPKADLIISNASLHWLENLPHFLDLLYEKLNPQGILAFTSFTENNLLEIKKITGQGLDYLSYQYIKKLLNKKFTIIKTEHFSQQLFFNDALNVLKHLKYTGVNVFSKSIWTKKDLHLFSEKYNKLFQTASGKVSLTYNPVLFILKK